MLKLRSLSVQQIALTWQKVNAIYLYNLFFNFVLLLQDF